MRANCLCGRRRRQHLLFSLLRFCMSRLQALTGTESCTAYAYVRCRAAAGLIKPSIKISGAGGRDRSKHTHRGHVIVKASVCAQHALYTWLMGCADSARLSPGAVPVQCPAPPPSPPPAASLSLGDRARARRAPALSVYTVNAPDVKDTIHLNQMGHQRGARRPSKFYII